MKKRTHAGGDRRRSRRSRVRARAEQLERQHGIPRPMAFQVAMGRIELNAVLGKMALRDRAAGLMRRYGFNKSLATQIALGQADLDHALRRQRMQAHLAEHRDRSVLDRAAASGEPIALGLHGLKVAVGRVTSVDRYEFRFIPGGDGEELIHKTRVKYAFNPTILKELGNRMRTRKDLYRVAEPILRPQDRYTCSDMRLFTYLDTGRTIAVTTLEGEVFTGQVDWMARWEFGMKIEGRLNLTIFRHALADIEEA